MEELEYYDGPPRLKDWKDDLVNPYAHYILVHPYKANWGVGRKDYSGERLIKALHDLGDLLRVPFYIHMVSGLVARRVINDYGDTDSPCVATAILLYSYHRLGLSLYAHITGEYGLEIEEGGAKSVLYYAKQSLTSLVGCSARRVYNLYMGLLERYGSGGDRLGVARHWLDNLAQWMETPYNVWLLANIILGESRRIPELWVKSIQPSDVAHGSLYLAGKIHGHQIAYTSLAARRVARRILSDSVIEVNV